MSFLRKMALLVEPNRTWQMATQGCLNASKLVYHVQGTVCSPNTNFSHPSSRGRKKWIVRRKAVECDLLHVL